MKKQTEFYPNIAYNKKRRLKYLALFCVLTAIILLMDAWFIADKMYIGLVMNVIIVVFIALIPTTLKHNPTKKEPILSVKGDSVIVSGRKIMKDDITSVFAIVYLGSVGNLVENRQFTEKCAAEKPLLEMTGSIEINYNAKAGKLNEFAVIENVTEALLCFVREGKIPYKLGYSLGKDYRVSTYNLNEFVAELDREEAEMREEQRQRDKKPLKGKMKDLI